MEAVTQALVTGLGIVFGNSLLDYLRNRNAIRKLSKTLISGFKLNIDLLNKLEEEINGQLHSDPELEPIKRITERIENNKFLAHAVDKVDALTFPESRLYFEISADLEEIIRNILNIIESKDKNTTFLTFYGQQIKRINLEAQLFVVLLSKKLKDYSKELFFGLGRKDAHRIWQDEFEDFIEKYSSFRIEHEKYLSGTNFRSKEAIEKIESYGLGKGEIQKILDHYRNKVALVNLEQRFPIREVKPTDSDANILIRAFEEDIYCRYVNKFSVNFASDTEPQDLFCLVVSFQEEPIAYGEICLVDQDIAEIRRMFVLPKYRRQGIGNYLLSKLERYAQWRNWKSIRLQTGICQQESIQLYERCHYRPTACFSKNTRSEFSLFYAKNLDS
jgi:GNAT superfamily N-acetyltransferase